MAKTYTITNTNNTQFTVSDGTTSTVIEKNTAVVASEGQYVRIKGMKGIKDVSFVFKYTQVSGASSASSLAATIKGYITDSSSRVVSALGAAVANTEATITNLKKRTLTIDGVAIHVVSID